MDRGVFEVNSERACYEMSLSVSVCPGVFYRTKQVGGLRRWMDELTFNACMNGPTNNPVGLPRGVSPDQAGWFGLFL